MSPILLVVILGALIGPLRAEDRNSGKYISTSALTADINALRQECKKRNSSLCIQYDQDEEILVDFNAEDVTIEGYFGYIFADPYVTINAKGSLDGVDQKTISHIVTIPGSTLRKSKSTTDLTYVTEERLATVLKDVEESMNESRNPRLLRIRRISIDTFNITVEQERKGSAMRVLEPLRALSWSQEETGPKTLKALHYQPQESRDDGRQGSEGFFFDNSNGFYHRTNDIDAFRVYHKAESVEAGETQGVSYLSGLGHLLRSFALFWSTTEPEQRRASSTGLIPEEDVDPVKYISMSALTSDIKGLKNKLHDWNEPVVINYGNGAKISITLTVQGANIVGPFDYKFSDPERPKMSQIHLTKVLFSVDPNQYEPTHIVVNEQTSDQYNMNEETGMLTYISKTQLENALEDAWRSIQRNKNPDILDIRTIAVDTFDTITVHYRYIENRNLLELQEPLKAIEVKLSDERRQLDPYVFDKVYYRPKGVVNKHHSGLPQSEGLHSFEGAGSHNIANFDAFRVYHQKESELTSWWYLWKMGQQLVKTVWPTRPDAVDGNTLSAGHDDNQAIYVSPLTLKSDIYDMIKKAEKADAYSFSRFDIQYDAGAVLSFELKGQNITVKGPFTYRYTDPGRPHMSTMSYTNNRFYIDSWQGKCTYIVMKPHTHDDYGEIAIRPSLTYFTKKQLAEILRKAEDGMTSSEGIPQEVQINSLNMAATYSAGLISLQKPLKGVQLSLRPNEVLSPQIFHDVSYPRHTKEENPKQSPDERLLEEPKLQGSPQLPESESSQNIDDFDAFRVYEKN